MLVIITKITTYIPQKSCVSNNDGQAKKKRDWKKASEAGLFVKKSWHVIAYVEKLQ